MLLSSLRRNVRGVAALEFGLIAPLFIMASLYGLELANLAMANLRLSQVADLAADNIARVTTKIDEAQVNEILYGAAAAGDSQRLVDNGRIIISSVERNSLDTGYWIRWQRCIGAATTVSRYGTGGGYDYGTMPYGFGYATNLLATLGTVVNPLLPPKGNATILVEVSTPYVPMISNALLGARTIRFEAASVVRQRTDFGITNLNNQTKRTC